jgi:type II secretory pathway pseudopilin PulG
LLPEREQKFVRVGVCVVQQNLSAVPYCRYMPVSASLSSSRVEVAPGGTATVELTVRNTGSVVDEFRIEVLGEGAQWTAPSPAVLPLFPGASAPVTITFNPPRRSDRVAGEVDVAIKVVSREDADGSAVEELVVAIGGFDSPDAELVPRTVRASRKANVQVAIDNLGNRRMQRSLVATDADQKLKFETVPSDVVVEAGRAEFAKVTIKPVKTFFRGPDRTIPYRVTLGEGEGESTVNLDGTFIQSAMLPKWLLRLLMMLLALLIALAAMWQFAFKPVIRSAARAAAEAQVDEAVKEASTNAAVETAKAIKLADAAIGAGPSAPGGNKPVDGTTKPAPAASPGPAPGDGTGSAGSGDDGKGGSAKSKRISVEAAPGATASAEWKPGGDNDRFSITDVVLQNAQGDTGKIRLKRGDEIILESALENFRDLDFHVIAPFIVEGKPIVIEVVCGNSAEVGPCKPAATVGGFLGSAPAKPAVTTTTQPSS